MEERKNIQIAYTLVIVRIAISVLEQLGLPIYEFFNTILLGDYLSSLLNYQFGSIIMVGLSAVIIIQIGQYAYHHIAVSMIPIWTIVIVMAYFIIVDVLSDELTEILDIEYLIILLREIPLAVIQGIQLIAFVVFSMQLINNQINNKTQELLKRLGMSYLLITGLDTLLLLLSSNINFPEIIYTVFSLLHILPLVAIFMVYQRELE